MSKQQSKPKAKKEEIQISARKTGRPEIYSDRIAEEICLRLMKGESLRKICKDDQMPHIDTVMNWLMKGDKPIFSEQYARARAIQAENMVDDILSITEDASGDRKFNAITGEYEEDREFTSRAKLRVETRLKLMQMLSPKKYGHKLDLTTGGDKIKAIEIIDVPKKELNEQTARTETISD